MLANDLKLKKQLRLKSKKRIRGKISGTSIRPRVTIFKSNKYLYAQAVNDLSGSTIVSINGKSLKLHDKVDDALELGKIFAEQLKNANINEVVFDRNGYVYHGVVASFASSLRDNGIAI